MKTGSVVHHDTESHWLVSDLAHQDCPKCESRVTEAIVMARVTGSVGSTSAEERRIDGEIVVTHSATVERHHVDVSDGIVDSFDAEAIMKWSETNRPEIIARVKPGSTWITVAAEDYAKLIGHPSFTNGE